MTRRPLLSLSDYQRIYQVIYSILEASGIAITHRACIFFAIVGTMILRKHYGLSATISAGCMALMVDEQKSTVVVYGRQEDSFFVSDEDAFRAWVECDGWLIDFMAPIMDVALRDDGHEWNIPRRMLQKPLADGKASLGEIQQIGDFFISNDPFLAESLIDKQSVRFGNLLKASLTLFRKPPKRLKEVALADSRGKAKTLIMHAPSIDGIW